MEGILPLWKEKGMTSHDCVFKLRKILGTKKIGHGGTLDPDVEGVLPIAVGRATKVIEYMIESGKIYQGEVTLGFSTTTEDATGEVVEEMPILSPIDSEEIDRVMIQFIGNLVQIPPMYSAVRVNGRRLYEYARAGEEVERPKREVEILSFKRTSKPKLNQENQTLSWRFEVECSKGTYVRTLAVDLGKALGFPAHMSQLTRVKSGGLTANQAFRLDEVEKAATNQDLSKILQPLEIGLKQFPHFSLSEAEWLQVKNGALLNQEDYKNIDFPCVFTYKEKAVAIYDHHEKKEALLKPKKVFRTEV